MEKSCVTACYRRWQYVCSPGDPGLGEITQVKPLDFRVIALRNSDNICNYQINPDGSLKV
ncbi:hypothetical protein P4S64_05295 [Vibrio sp. M60_M31a]